ncbi:MAG: hypothetical protein C4540_05905 [Candidatus Omnitrophota bacterium]|nr:MAG: hypothetical protein C4540_05905 [Candidatus Omnitrophota bacterium]
MVRFNLFDALQNHSAGIVIVAIALILARNSYGGQAQTIKSLINRIDSEKKKNEELLRIEKAKKLTESALQLINRKNLSMVINHINDFAKESLVTVASIRPQPEKVYGDYTVYPYDMSLSVSGYHALAEFISLTENSQDVFIIEELSIKLDTQNESLGRSPRLVAGMRVNTYWMNE